MKRRVLRVLALPGVILAIIALFFGIERTTWSSLDDQPVSYHTTNTATPDKGVVYLNGAGTPRTVIDDLRPFFARQGNFEEVVYGHELFDIEKTVNLVIEKIKPYSHVTFVGASMGGLVAYDVIQELRKRGDHHHFGLILIDSPTGKWADVGGVPWGAKLAACLPFGKLSNGMFSSPRPQGDLSQIHPKDPGKMEKFWDEYATYPWSGYSSQGCYVFYHDVLQPLEGVTATFIRSQKDTFVLDSAIEEWRNVVKLEDTFRVNASHMSFLDEPVLYEQAFQKSFALAAG